MDVGIGPNHVNIGVPIVCDCFLFIILGVYDPNKVVSKLVLCVFGKTECAQNLPRIQSGRNPLLITPRESPRRDEHMNENCVGKGAWINLHVPSRAL